MMMSGNPLFLREKAWLGFMLLSILAAPVLTGPTPADARTRTSMLGPEAEARISPEGDRTFVFRLPESAGNLKTVLTWEARVDADRSMTGREFLGVTLNGTSVGAMRDRLNRRLLNKPVRFTGNADKLRYWYTEGAEGWLTPFAPDFAVPVPGWSYGPPKDAYTFQVDVTDLIQPGAENRLVFRNLTKEQYVRKYEPRYFRHTRGEIVLRNIFFDLLHERISVRAGSAPERRTGETIESLLKISPSGAMEIQWCGRTATIETLFAQGDGRWTGFAEGAGGREILRPDPSTWRVSLKTRLFRVERTVRRDRDRIEINDRLVLEEHSDVAVIAPRVRISVAENTYGTIWLGGDKDPSLEDASCPSNPTLFLPMDGAGLGLVLEDDVFRLQARFSYDAGAGDALIRSDEMVLSKTAGGEYTLRYALYPVSKDSYWDFINSAREEWNSHQTMPGTIWFTTPGNIVLSNPESIRRYLRENRVAYVVFWEGPHPQGDRIHTPYIVQGTGQLHPRAVAVRGAFEADERKGAEKLHRIMPGVKVLFYIHSHVCSMMDPEQMDSLQDSLVIGEDGKPVRRHAGDGRFFPLYYVYPTSRNSYGKAFERLIDHVLGLGADGIYWDEMSAAAGEVRCTYSEFDGYTADVDLETQEIQRLKGLVSLLSSDYKVGQVRRLLDRERAVHANSAPETVAQNRLPITRMVEAQTSSAAVKDLHLTTPYAYTWAPFSMDQFRDRLFKGGLCFRPGKETPFIARSYPITPVSLGRGYVVGRERIITGVGGVFGWEDLWKAALWTYDGSGRMVERRLLEGEGGREIPVPPNGLTIMERLQ
jgi:hypothetical protein